MKTITTTTGDIVNLDQVAMITVAQRESKEPVLMIHFSASLNTSAGARSLSLPLTGDEARSFLKALEAHGVDVGATLKALNKEI